jgi:hypothetical protein
LLQDDSAHNGTRKLSLPSSPRGNGVI